MAINTNWLISHFKDEVTSVLQLRYLSNQSIFLRCTTAVLSVIAENDLVIAGTFGSRIVLFDRRADSQLINSLNVHILFLWSAHNSIYANLFKIHGRAVLSVATDGNYLYSCGEDKFVYCLDRRMWTVVCRARVSSVYR